MLRQHNDARATAISTRGADCGRSRPTALLVSIGSPYSYTYQNHAPRHAPLVSNNS